MMLQELFLMSPPGPTWSLRGRANFRSEAASQVDAAAALREWLTLADAIELRGGRVVCLLPPEDSTHLTGLPFAAECGQIVEHDGELLFLLPNMGAAHRVGERALWEPLARAMGLRPVSLEGTWEAQGDVAFFEERTLLFHGGRTDRRGATSAAPFFRDPLLISLRQPAFHGNMAVLPIEAAGLLLVCPEVLVGEGLERLVEAFGTDRIVHVSEHELRAYAANGLPMHRTLLAPHLLSVRVKSLLEARGIEVVLLAMHELCEKAGGASRCLVSRAQIDGSRVRIPQENDYRLLRDALWARASSREGTTLAMLIEVEREVRCRSQLKALWELLTDTERLNRAVGMDHVVYRPNTDATAARFVGTTNLGGFDVEYEERPSEWVYGQHFRITRLMRSGPVERLETIFRIEALPGGDGSVVRVRLVFLPKLALMAPIIRMRAKKSLDRFAQEIERIDAALASGDAVRAVASVRINEQAFAHAAELLRARAPGESTERLLLLLREHDDVEVMRLRPFVLADEWGASRSEVLSVMLQSVQCGLLDLRWELVCPSCRVAAETVPTLAELRAHGACQLCEIDFALDVDEALEVTFSPSRAVRVVEAGPFCIAGPAMVPHVVAQVVVAAHGIGTLVAPKAPGRFRLFLRGGQSAWVEVLEGARATFSVPTDALSLRGEHVLRVAPGGVLLVANPTNEERHAKLERAGGLLQSATAREVTALAAFRRDFSSDVLKPGASLKVSRVSLFFSDLTASTQLYSRVGDAAAFRLVQDHFDVVLACIERHHGALVKTIGDAVMAVFADEADGLRASMEILRIFENFRAEHPDRMLTHIKLGLFAGPCFVVTANGVLDYFGQTVNIAARLQAQADSGELVVTAELAERAIAQGIVPGAILRERYDASLKGIDAPVRVARLVAVEG